MQHSWTLLCTANHKVKDYFTIEAETAGAAIDIIISTHGNTYHIFNIVPNTGPATNPVNQHFYKPNAQPLKINDLNAAIGENFPGVYLAPGHDSNGNYFQLISEDEKIAMQFASLPVTRVYVNTINDLTIPEWVMAVAELLEYKRG